MNVLECRFSLKKISHSTFNVTHFHTNVLTYNEPDFPPGITSTQTWQQLGFSCSNVLCCSTAASIWTLSDVEPREPQSDQQTRRERSGCVGATCTGSPYPNARRPPSEEGALSGRLRKKEGKPGFYYTSGKWEMNLLKVKTSSNKGAKIWIYLNTEKFWRMKNLCF